MLQSNSVIEFKYLNFFSVKNFFYILIHKVFVSLFYSTLIFVIIIFINFSS